MLCLKLNSYTMTPYVRFCMQLRTTRLVGKKESDAALRELIAKYQSIDASEIADVYAFRNQPDEAFSGLTGPTPIIKKT